MNILLIAHGVGMGAGTAAVAIPTDIHTFLVAVSRTPQYKVDIDRTPSMKVGIQRTPMIQVER